MLRGVRIFFKINKVPDDTKLLYFLTIVGPKTYGLLKNLILPKTPESATYTEAVKAIKEHYKPQKNPIYERFVFYKRNQKSGESIADYVASIKALAATCEFGSNLEEMLRDRFIQGIANGETQHYLLTDATMDFTRAVSIAKSREAAAREVEGLGQGQGVAINKLDPKAYKANKPSPVPSSGSSNPKPTSSNNSKPTQACSGCGRRHWKSECPFKDAECFQCKRRGHIAKVCRNKSQGTTVRRDKNNYISSNVELVDREYDEVFCLTGDKIPPIPIKILLNGKEIVMELDTGATRSVMPRKVFEKLWPVSSERPTLTKTNTRLEAYGGAPLLVAGEIRVKACRKEQPVETQVRLIILDGDGPQPCLLGRDLLKPLAIKSIDASQVNKISTSNFIGEFPSLFAPGLGCMKGKEVTIEVDPTVSPKFCKARPVPYALRDRVDAELGRLEEEGIISPITNSPWAAAIVPVVKSDDKIRICGDYRLTVNRAARLDTYPIPRLTDLFNSLAGGIVFSKLDMSQAYAQLMLHEDSKPYTVINTQKGLFKYNRLCFGVSSAPGIFQRTMEDLLKSIPGIFCYLDDILVSGATKAEHDDRVRVLLGKLQDSGLKLRADKCQFGVKEVNYLGYKIDATGLHPTEEKVKAIVKAPSPANITQLRAFLGLLNFYRRFIPKASTLLEPLNKLLRAKEVWSWGREQEHAFVEAKQALLNSGALTHFDPTRDIIVVADSSAYGVGAVLCHSIDGVERPVCFVSRTLNKAERNYSQLEKEALALIYALSQFHNYLWGQSNFTLVTDHKPLLGLFSQTKNMSPQASGRIQRWSLLLQSYKFMLVHRSGSLLGTADALSRLPLPTTSLSPNVPGEWNLLVNFLDSSPVTCNDIKTHTHKDPVLSKVYKLVELGWPQATVSDSDLLPFSRRKEELSIQAGCVLWGTRVVVPTKLRTEVLTELHSGHTGSSKMKELARSYVWWPDLDKDLESLCSSCPECLALRNMPPKAELHPWDWPKTPWHRLHVDYAGPIDGKWYLVVVDSHSKWVEIMQTGGTTAKETISCLRHIFSRFGIPVSIVSDNGPCFTSEEFAQFADFCGFKHITTAVYKPSTNGLAERMVQSFKRALKSSKDPVLLCLDRFLFKYRITPHSTTGVSPAELMLGRKLRNRLDLLWPMDGVASRVRKKQTDQGHHHSRNPRIVSWAPGDPVMVRNYSRIGPQWSPAVVKSSTGPLSYRCDLPDGRTVKRHQDQVHSREITPTVAPPSPPPTLPALSHDQESGGSQTSPEVLDTPIVEVSPTVGTQLRRSSRNRNAPTRLNL